MRKIDMIRAWKDPEYLASLTEEERASIEPDPAGGQVLSEQALKSVMGGTFDLSADPRIDCDGDDEVESNDGTKVCFKE